MATRKRSIIPIQRLEELRKEGVVYEVRCAIADCPCGNPRQGCGRGFFSLFIQAVYGIEFAKRLHIPYYINFGNCIYAYSDIKNSADPNFWNYYFDQPLDALTASSRLVINDIMEVYPLRIWNRDFIKSMFNQVVKDIKYNGEVKDVFKTVSDNFGGRNILGVHIRRTDHHEEIAPVKIESYVKEIDKRIGKIDGIFLATDDADVVDFFKKKYGDLLVINNSVRSTGGIAVHDRMGANDKRKLGLDALIVCYSLSRCQEVILTHSNLSYAALLLNPELKYKLMERFETRIDRLKTLLLYNLNRWNIRKW